MCIAYGPGTELPPQHEVELAEGVVALIHGDGSAGMSNSAVLLGDSTAVIDTMLLPEMAVGIRTALTRRGRTADLVINTHNHADHIGGNGVFADARILAHPRTVASTAAMLQPTLPALLKMVMPKFAPRLEDWTATVAEPTAIVELQRELPIEAQVLAFTDTHSSADLAVWLPAERVLLAGDLCFNAVTPLAVHGQVGRWRTALDELIALNPCTVLPGHGPVGDQGVLPALADYLDRVLDAAARAHAEHLQAETVWESFDPGPAADWLEPERTLVNIRIALSEKNRTSAQGEHHVRSQDAPNPR